MKSLLKYLVIILMTVIFMIVLLNQFAPILIKVPNKDTQEIKINFDEMPIRKNFNQQGKTAKNIILMIGDGMGANQVLTYRIAKGGPNYLTSFDKFPITGLVKTHSVNTLITDSAAAATAYSTGSKTINRYIGVDKDGKNLKNLTEILYEKGFVSSLIATSEITHATPAAFAAHNISRYDDDGLAEDFFKSNIYMLLGGGRDFFLPKSEGGQRSDELNLIEGILSSGHLLADKKDLEEFKHKDKKRIFGLFAEEELIRSANEPNLTEMLKFSISNSELMVDEGCNGFFVMAEGSQIDWAGHDNDFDTMFKEMEEFDNAVEAALNYAKINEDTLLVVLADHETGGLLLEMDDLRYGPSKNMRLSWNTAIGKGSHTGAMIPVYAYGPGAEMFSGIMDNTDVFFAMNKAVDVNSLSEYTCH